MFTEKMSSLAVLQSGALLNGHLEGIGGDLATSLGGRKKFRRPRFLNDFLGKNSIFTPKISDDFF